MRRKLTWIVLAIAIATPFIIKYLLSLQKSPELDSSGFVNLTDVVPDAIIEARYFGTYNFVGARIDGYLEPVVLYTREAAEALRAVSDDVKARGYRLKVYDAYRPQCAVDHFVRWGKDLADSLMRPYFYPDEEKAYLFERGYIAERSGHTRGSAIDLTLFDMATGKELDMGGVHDWFGIESHPDYGGNPETGEYFKTVDEFKSLIDYNGFIEWAQYVENYYGTPRKFVEDEIAAGKNVILEIE